MHSTPSDFDFDFDPTAGATAPPSRPAGYVPSYLNSLNERQREAVETTQGPLMVLAGAGSGKTKMLTARISNLIDSHHVPPHQILAVTFTNKAAGEMRERVAHMLEGSSALGSPEIGTFHAVCVRILRREAIHTPYTKPFVIYDDADTLALVKGAIQKLSLDEKAYNPKAMRSGIDRLKCDAITPEEMQPAQHNLFERQLKRVYEQYQKDLFTNNAIDFGEILCMTYRIFRDHDEVRARYQRRFKYIHVDEYQDTNRAQYLLLSQLASKRHGGHENICVVGDEDQSIYKWRGADINNILDFETDYPGGKIVKLEQNYRSTQTIITAASEVIKNNTERKDKRLWTDNERGVPLVRAQLPDERAEAEWVVGEIKRMAQHESRTYKDFAIFYRTHAQSRQFEDVFRREKISYQIVGGLRFYDRKEIKDILSYFKVVMNASDSISLKRIINTPGRGIGKTTIDRLEEIQNRSELAGGDPSFWGALQAAVKDPTLTSNATAKKLGVFAQFIERLIVEQPKLGVSELYHLILDETGYVRELRSEGTEEALGRIENLEEFDSLLQEFEEDHPDTPKSELLIKFIEDSALVSDADREGVPTASICMMSLHSSKGLEYPVVFLVGMEEGLFPSLRPWEDSEDNEIEEERRLCYVGMTRARETLCMSHVAVRRLWGNVSYQEPARFFEEIPAELVQFKDFTRANAPQFRAGSSAGWGSASTKARVPAKTNWDAEVSQVSGDGEWVGRKIDHPEYGMGTILGLEGSGEQARVTIEFKGRDRRKFLLRFVRSFALE